MKIAKSFWINSHLMSSKRLFVSSFAEADFYGCHHSFMEDFETLSSPCNKSCKKVLGFVLTLSATFAKTIYSWWHFKCHFKNGRFPHVIWKSIQFYFWINIKCTKICLKVTHFSCHLFTSIRCFTRRNDIWIPFSINT